MDDWVRKELDDRITKLEREAARVRKGVVTDIGPLSVALGGADSADAIVGLSAIDGLALAVDDVVTVLARGNDMLVVGRVGHGTIRGEVAANGSVLHGTGFSVNKTGTGAYAVIFTDPFPDVPIIVVAAGATAGANTAKITSTGPPTVNGFSVSTFTTDTPTNLDSRFTFIATPA